jgi:hypothetical protein
MAISTNGKLYGWGANASNMAIGYPLSTSTKILSAKKTVMRRSDEFVTPAELNSNRELVVIFIYYITRE